MVGGYSFMQFLFCTFLLLSVSLGHDVKKKVKNVFFSLELSSMLFDGGAKDKPEQQLPSFALFFTCNKF